MNDAKDRGEPKTVEAENKKHAGSRQDRLKLALRENLKRRKSQARGRGDVTPTPSSDDRVSSPDFRSKPGE